MKPPRHKGPKLWGKAKLVKARQDFYLLETQISLDRVVHLRRHEMPQDLQGLLDAPSNKVLVFQQNCPESGIAAQDIWLVKHGTKYSCGDDFALHVLQSSTIYILRRGDERAPAQGRHQRPSTENSTKPDSKPEARETENEHGNEQESSTASAERKPSEDHEENNDTDDDEDDDTDEADNTIENQKSSENYERNKSDNNPRPVKRQAPNPGEQDHGQARKRRRMKLDKLVEKAKNQRLVSESSRGGVPSAQEQDATNQGATDCTEPVKQGRAFAATIPVAKPAAKKNHSKTIKNLPEIVEALQEDKDVEEAILLLATQDSDSIIDFVLWHGGMPKLVALLNVDSSAEEAIIFAWKVLMVLATHVPHAATVLQRHAVHLPWIRTLRRGTRGLVEVACAVANSPIILQSSSYKDILRRIVRSERGIPAILRVFEFIGGTVDSYKSLARLLRKMGEVRAKYKTMLVKHDTSRVLQTFLDNYGPDCPADLHDEISQTLHMLM